MRDDAYEGVPGVFDLVRGRARGLTDEQIYREHDRKVVASKKVDKEKVASFLDTLRRGLHSAGGALKPLAKEPALIAAIAAPLVGAGVNEVSKHREALRQAKAKADNYRTMMELTPRLRIHDQKEIGRIYNTLHNINPMMGNDPLIAGAWIDNIMENKGTLGETSSHQALLNAVKDLSGIRSSLSQAMRNERKDSTPGNKIEGLVSGVGKDVEKALHAGINAREKQVQKLMDDRTEKFMELAQKKRDELQALHRQVQSYAQDVHAQSKHAADETGLALFFQAAGIT
jgi:hypothetical protein